MPVRLVSHEELPGPLKGYRLIERLGRGGFGEVWKCEAPGGMLKAVKFVFGDLDAVDDDESRPAEQELKALHRVKTIRHPYILTLERFDKIDGQLIIVMELADRNLWDRFRQCRAEGLIGIPRAELLNYMDEAAEALDLMNQHYQIQHLDVKPQNIFLVYNHIKVADFGLAKVFEGARGTITGGVTPVYAAPETFEGYVSRFTDQYSLAIVFQELLTGKRPIDGTNTKQLMMQHLNGTPDLSTLSESDRAVIGRGLAKQPDDRWPTCTEMVQALRHGVASVSVGTRTPSNGWSKDETPVPSLVAAQRPMTAQATALQQAAAGTVTARTTALRPGSGTVGPMIRAGFTTAAPGLGALLTTPKLVTPKVAGLSQTALTLTQGMNAAPHQSVRLSALGLAPPEKTGEGVLVPALIVGVGATGLAVLRTLRRFVRERYGSTDALPHLRYLYIDTDPDAQSLAMTGSDPLVAKEIIVAKLNRPSHYLQSSSAPDVGQWMPPGLLYQLPKNAAPSDGVRGFGRLALCDHYRSITARIRAELEQFQTDSPLATATENTGLELRDNRMRAYVIAGTAGGTGSGMFLDLGYILKNELRSCGYANPQTIGVLLTPPSEATTPRTLPLANTYTALAELHHYAHGHRFVAKFDANEQAIDDSTGPFARTTVLGLPAVLMPKLQTDAYGNAARILFSELLSHAGKTADHIRTIVAEQSRSTLPGVSSIGLYRLTWPRAEMLGGAMRHFNRQLLTRWAGKEATHLKEPLSAWLDELWTKQQLVPEVIIARLHAAAGEAMRETPEAVFAAAVDTLRTRTPAAGRHDAAAACNVLDQLLKLVGKPAGDQEEPGSLEDVLKAVRTKIVKELEADLSMLAVTFIEQPQYRLAGAEESLNQLAGRLKATIDALQANEDELRKDVQATYARLFQLIGLLQNASGLAGLPGRRSALSGDLHDCLQNYPAKRLRASEVASALTVYRSLLGNIPEYLRDVNFCRQRLLEIQAAFLEPAKSAEGFLRGRLILPQGCATIAGAVEQVIDALPPDDMLAYDLALQRILNKKFRGLANLCLKAERTEDFVQLLAKETRDFLDARLEKTDPATILLRYFGQGSEAAQMLREAYESALPVVVPVTDSKPLEACILAMPTDATGDPVRRLLAQVCRGVEFIPAPQADEIVFHREYPRLELARLPQLGPAAREAYEIQRRGDLTPHTRTDIRWNAPPSE